MILSYLQAGEVLKCSVPKTRANTARCVGSIMRFLALCTCTVCTAQQTGCTWRPTQTKPVKAKVHQLASQAKMTSSSGVALAYWYVQRLNEWRVPGDIVECGVWKGGVSAFMAVAQLEAEGRGQVPGQRKHWLYDTFEGMSRPSDKDGWILAQQWDHINATGTSLNQVPLFGRLTGGRWRNGAGPGAKWSNGGGPADVNRVMAATGLPCERQLFVQGKVEDTLADAAIALPTTIALLRLDTDWYNSTMFELEVLLPRLQPGGVLIFDDFFTTFSGATGHVPKGNDGCYTKPSPCCSGLAVAEHFSPALVRRGMELSRRFWFDDPMANGTDTPVDACDQFRLARSHVENEIDSTTGKLSTMRDEKYWATLDEVLATGYAPEAAAKAVTAKIAAIAARVHAGHGAARAVWCLEGRASLGS